MASYNFLRECNPGFKSWEEPKDSKIDPLALKVLRNYYERKHPRPASSAGKVYWKAVAENLAGKKIE